MSLTITTTLSLSSQSVANNTSTVTWKVKYSKSSSTYNNNGISAIDMNKEDLDAKEIKRFEYLDKLHITYQN